MRANLIAVQARFELPRYASLEAFRESMRGLVQKACAAADPALPSLVVLPEGLGLFLSFAPFYYDDIKDLNTVGAAILKGAIRHWPSLLGTALRHRVFGLRTALLHHALETREAYLSTFSDLARQEGVYIVGGTCFLPDVDQRPLHEPSLRGRNVYNVSPFFTPGGHLLMSVKKQHRASRWERRFAFAEGSESEVYPANTAIGPVGVLVCHDALRAELLQRVDAMGTRVLAVPAYNLAPWHAEVRGKGVTHEEAWLDRGLPKLVQGRENIRFAVCSMLVGSMFDVRSEGRSFICQNLQDRPGDAIVALASSEKEEEAICVQAELGEADAAATWSSSSRPQYMYSAGCEGGEHEIRFGVGRVRADAGPRRDPGR